MRTLHLSLCATKSTTAGKNRVLIVRRQSTSPSYILYYAYIELLVIPDPSSGDDPGHLLFDEMGKEKREKERKKPYIPLELLLLQDAMVIVYIYWGVQMDGFTTRPLFFLGIYKLKKDLYLIRNGSASTTTSIGVGKKSFLIFSGAHPPSDLYWLEAAAVAEAAAELYFLLTERKVISSPPRKKKERI